MTIVFSGTLGRSGMGGKSWVNMQYLIGLKELGHDVVYLEDAGPESWVYRWEEQDFTTDLSYPGATVRECLEPLGLGDRWIYRAGAESVGMSIEDFREACAAADLLIVRAVPLAPWRSEYDLPKRRAFIDVDPGFTQMRLANGEEALCETVSRCETVFTVGQRIGEADCPVPTVGRDWIRTLPPVALSQWPVAAGTPTHFTSVMDWRGFRDVRYGGTEYGQKDRSFQAFLDLPNRTDQPMRMALTGDAETLRAHGWEVIPGEVPSATPWSYRDFIQGSRAEFGVAKHGYVETRGGWFSDRSACYLASGRPVLIQDTGIAGRLAPGRGVVLFHDLDSALAGIESINADYEGHRRAARSLAESYIATDRVLPPLLDAATA